MTQQEFIVSLEEKGIVLSEKQIEQFEKYYEILVAGRKGLFPEGASKRRVLPYGKLSCPGGGHPFSEAGQTGNRSVVEVVSGKFGLR